MGDMFGALAKHYHEGGWMMHPSSCHSSSWWGS